MGIDDEVNGVFLPAEKHNNLHNYKYYDAIDEALAGAKSKDEAEQILRSIGEHLKSGTFP